MSQASRCQQCGEWFEDPWQSMYCPSCEDYREMRKEDEEADGSGE